MLQIDIPSRGLLRLEHLVLDVNGTLALDGQILPGVGVRLAQLRQSLEVTLVSADTHGGLASIAELLKVRAVRLQPGGEPAQKLRQVETCGPERVVVIGNGANDVEMLRRAALGIAVLGGEGLATACLLMADVIAPDILVALDLLLFPRRLVATLRA